MDAGAGLWTFLRETTPPELELRHAAPAQALGA